MKKTINIFSENINKNFEIDEKKAIDIAKGILNFFLSEPKIFELSCLKDQKFDTISFDILYCDSEKTHEINKEYRQKDYAADIITFAIFADSEEKFVFDGEINLGEIIISLDKVAENAKQTEALKLRSLEALQNIDQASKLPSCQTSKNINCEEFEKQLHFLIAHGIMHLLGFDHQTNEDYNFIVESQTSALKKVLGE